MFGWLTRRRRYRVASLLAVLYVLCLASPTTIMAFGLGSNPAHCLTDDHQDIGVVHVHQDGSTQHHSGGKDDDGDRTDDCCGLFGVSAIVPDVAILLVAQQPTSHRRSFAADSPTGRNSDRIDRPPRSRSSL
jgi:hypothetical protein